MLDVCFHSLIFVITGLTGKTLSAGDGIDDASAGRQSDIRLRPGIKVYVGLGGTGRHSQLQDDRHGKTAKGVFSFHRIQV
jgi:hypothetical protein